MSLALALTSTAQDRAPAHLLLDLFAVLGD